MKTKQTIAKRTFIVRLERCDEVIGKLIDFCKSNKIEGGTVSGIGALSRVKIYSVQDSKKFIAEEETIEKPMELVSALGNIAIKENGEPIVHLHVCLGLPDHSAKTGHLLEGIVSYTGEFFIQETERITKKKEGDLLLMEL